MFDMSHPEHYLFRWIYNTCSEWPYPLDIFEKIKIIEAKTLQIPFSNFEVSTVYSWKITYYRNEQYISHYKQDGNKSIPVYKTQKHTHDFWNDGPVSRKCTFGTYQTLDDSIISLFNEYSELTKENLYKIINERNYVSSETMLAKSEKMIKNRCINLLVDFHAKDYCRPNLPSGYNWMPDSSTIKFNSLTPTITTEYRDYLFIEYEYEEKSYYFLLCPTEDKIKYTSPPSLKKEIAGNLTSRLIIFYFIPLLLSLPFLWWLKFETYLFDSDITNWSFFATLSLIILPIYDYFKQQSKLKKAIQNGQKEIENHIRTNRHDLCPILGVAPLDNIIGNQTLQDEALKNKIQDEYYRKKELFIQKYRDLGYQEKESIFGQKTVMSNGVKEVKIYLNQDDLTITIDE